MTSDKRVAYDLNTSTYAWLICPVLFMIDAFKKNFFHFPVKTTLFPYTCSEKWRPKPVIPATSLKVEGEVTRKTSSTTEHFPAMPYCRQAPTPRQANLSLSKEDISMSTETTYRKNSATVLGSPLKRALRYNPVFRKHDNIDWM